MKILMRALFFILAAFWTTLAFAQSGDANLNDILSFALEHAPTLHLAKKEVDVTKAQKSSIASDIVFPKVDLAAGYQSFRYDKPFDYQAGGTSSNDGHNEILSLTASYDLQRLFGSETLLAKTSLDLAKLKAEIARRDLIRSVKAAYYSLLADGAKNEETHRQIKLYKKVETVLRRQSRLGVFNDYELQQVQVQENFLEESNRNRESEVEANTLLLARLTGMEVSALKPKLGAKIQPPKDIDSDPPLDATALADQGDKKLFENFKGGYNLAEAERRGYTVAPLPSVYVRADREWPTMRSSDGPQTLIEAGVSFPLSSFLTRSKEKQVLAANAELKRLESDQAIQEYKNQIRLAVTNFNRLKDQYRRISALKDKTANLQRRSFTLLSQRRIDVLGTLDIFAKSLEANQQYIETILQIRLANSDLDYLLGRKAE